MTKVLFLVTIVVLAVSAFLSFQNKQAYASFRADRKKANDQIVVQLTALKKAQAEYAKVDGELKEVESDINQASERTDQAKIALKNASSNCDRISQDIATNQTRKKDLETQLQDALKDVPKDVGLENLKEHIDQTKTTVANNEKQVEDAEKATKSKQEELKKVQEQLEELNKRIDDRKKLYERNALNATVIAVNNDWGFLVINAGENKKITVDTKLLVTRGSETLGKLDIVSVDGNKTIANIVQKSLRPGVAIAPGDHVILETLMQ